MMKKLLALLLATVMIVGLLAGCGSSETKNEESGTEKSADGKTKITILRPGDEEKVASFLEPAVEAFEAANPDIDVEIMYESWAGWIQTYSTYFDANTQPDVIFWWDNKLHDSSAESHLVNLENYLSADFFAQIPEGVWNLVDPGDIEGTVYVPSSVDAFVLYYNKEVFEAAGLDPEAPPTTWSELYNAAKTIYEKTGKPGIGTPAITGSETLEEFVGVFLNQATKSDVLTTDGAAAFDNEKGLEALTFVESLVPYYQASCTEYGRGELRSLLRDGEIGMLVDAPWAIPTYTAAYGDDLKASIIGIASMPTADDGSKVTWAGTNGWIATKEETAEASAKLIEFLMSPEQLVKHHVAYGSAPLYEEEFDNEAFQYDHWKVFYDEIQNYELHGMIGKNSPTPSAYYTALEEVWQQLVLGQVNAEEALKMAVTAVDNVTARSK